MADHSHAHGSDKGAAFTGLILTSIALFAVCFAIVKWTNSLHHGEEAAAGHAPAAAAPASK